MEEREKEWWFVEEFTLNDESDLVVGMETSELVWDQVKKDLLRMHVTLNGVRVTEPEHLFAKLEGKLALLRHCTQAVFCQPLEKFTKLFPTYILTHPRPDIFVRVKKHVCSGAWCQYLSSRHTPEIKFTISTSFLAVDELFCEPCFDIDWDLTFVFGAQKGVLTYKLSEIL